MLYLYRAGTIAYHSWYSCRVLYCTRVDHERSCNLFAVFFFSGFVFGFREISTVDVPFWQLIQVGVECIYTSVLCHCGNNKDNTR